MNIRLIYAQRGLFSIFHYTSTSQVHITQVWLRKKDKAYSINHTQDGDSAEDAEGSFWSAPNLAMKGIGNGEEAVYSNRHTGPDTASLGYQ